MINLSTCTHFGFNQCAICYFAAFSEFWTCVYHHDAHICPCWSMLSWYDIIVISKLTSPQLLSTYVSRFFSTTKSVIISIFIQIFFSLLFYFVGTYSAFVMYCQIALQERCSLWTHQCTWSISRIVFWPFDLS